MIFKMSELKIKTAPFLIPIFLIFLSSCIQDSTNNIQVIHSFNEVDFSSIQPNSLVIFDVDETLIQPKDAYLINENSQQAQAFRKKMLQKYPHITPDEWTTLASIMLQQANRPLIELGIVQKINELKNRNVPVIACTSMNTGTYGMLPSMEQWRSEHLKSLGFTGSFDSIITFNIFSRKPVFYKSMLATDTEKKGPVIGAFLDKTNLHPEKIIMFDDEFDYLVSVQEECKKRGIEFQGYQYKGAVEAPWNEQLAEFQADYLIQHKTWLSDQEAEKYLQQPNSALPLNKLPN